MTADLDAVGATHPDVKLAKALLQRPVASAPGKLAVEGIWAHETLLDLGVRPRVLLLSPDDLHSERARSLADAMLGCADRAYTVSARTLARVAERDKPDGLVSIVEQPVWGPDDVTFGDGALVLVADGIESPGNLGTMVRTLDGAGGACLVMTDRRTVPHHPKAFKASHGTTLATPVVTFDAAADAAEWLRRNGFSVHLAEPEGSVPYGSARHRARVAFVVGNERYGVSPEWRALGLDRVALPMLGRADSLNAAAAAAVLLYDARARNPATGQDRMPHAPN